MSTTKNDLYIGKGTKDSVEISQVFVESGTGGKGIFYSAAQQAVENGMDAGADKIFIVVDRKNKVLRFIDNGTGFGQKQVDGFLSLCVSPKAGVAGLIGQRGSGRWFLFQFCKKVIVYSKSDEFEGYGKLELTLEDMVELLNTEGINRPYQKVKKPSCWSLPDGQNGTVIELVDVDWDRVPTANDIRKNFARYLNPMIATKVRVNSKRLNDREILGEMISEVFEVPELGGPCRIDLYLPKGRTYGHDQLEIGGHNPIMPIDEFKAQLFEQQPGLSALMPSNLRQGPLCGVIYIPLLNDYVAHSRRGLKNEFFTTPEVVRQVVNFLKEKVGNLVEEKLNEIQQEANARKQQKQLLDVCGAFNSAFPLTEQDLIIDDYLEGQPPVNEDDDDDETEKAPVLELNVRPKQLTAMPGDTIDIEVTANAGTSGSFEWDASESGGRLDTPVGPRVRFTAGRTLGNYVLLVKDRRSPRKFARVRIKIVAEKSLRIVPGGPTLEAGDTHQFRLQNREVTTGRFGWQITPPNAKVRLAESEGKTTSIVIDDDAPRKEFKITATDLGDPEVSAEALFTIIDPPPSSGNHIKIQGNVYLISFVEPTSGADLRFGPVVQLEKNAVLDLEGTSGQKTMDRLWVNPYHPNWELLMDIKTERDQLATFMFLLDDIIKAHLVRRFEDGDYNSLNFDPDTYFSEREEIREQVLRAKKAEK